MKIAIVGGGPAGSMAALLLSKAGHQVTLFEKRDSIPVRLCGEYLCPRGVELLDQYQLTENFCMDFLPLEGMILNSPQQLSVECSFPKTSKKWKGLSLNRQTFDRRILAEAEKFGADVKMGTSIRHVERGADLKWSLLTDKGSYFCYLLIAADGRVSSVAKILGHAAKIDTSRVAVHFYLPKKKFHNVRFGEMHIFNDRSYCGLDPIQDDHVNVSFVFDAEKMKGRELRQLCNSYLKQSSRLTEMFGIISDEIDIKTITPLTSKNTFVAGHGLAYLGDASGFIDPLTGEGIYNALLSAHLLNEALSEKKDLGGSLSLYKNNKRKIQFQKKILNHIFQFVIRSPILCLMIAKFLQTKTKRADSFIGIIGNIYTPVNGLLKMFF